MLLTSQQPLRPPVLKAQPRELHVGHFGLWKSMCPRHFDVKHDGLRSTDQIQISPPPAPLVPLLPSSQVQHPLSISIISIFNCQVCTGRWLWEQNHALHPADEGNEPFGSLVTSPEGFSIKARDDTYRETQALQ